MRRHLKLIVFATLVLFLLLLSPYKLLRVSGESMEPTLKNGDWVLVQQGMPKPNQIVAFMEPTSNYQAIKRCVAMGGDEVQIIPPHLFVNKAFFAETIGLEALLKKEISLSNERLSFLDGNGHKVSFEVSFEALDKKSSFGLKRGSIEVFFSVDPRSKLVELFLSGGVLRKPRLLGTKDFSGGVLNLMLSFVGGQLVAEWNGESAIKPLPFSKFPYSPEELEFSVESLILEAKLFNSFSLWQEKNYEVSGNFASEKGFRVKPGHYFMLGENSKLSRDSRHYGGVQQSSIIGVVVAHWESGPK